MPTMARRSSCVAGRTLTALAAFAIRQRSLHVNALGRDLHDHPRLVGPKTFEGLAGVDAGELVDVLIRARQDQLGAPSYRQHVPVGMGRVEHCDRDPVVALEVAGLEAWKSRVEVDVLAVRLDPHDR